MSKISRRTLGSTITRFQIPTGLFTGLAIVALLMSAGLVRAGDPDDDYLPIYSQLQDADSLEAGGQATQALAKYKAALTALQSFQRSHPEWNPKMVSTRVNHLVEKISALSEKTSLAGQTGTNAAAGGSASASSRNGASAGTAKLLEAGAEPRKVLRLHPKAGDKQTVDLTLKIGTQVGQTQGPANKIPAVKLTLESTVKSVSAEGDITYDMVMSDAGLADDAGVAPQVAEMLKASFAKAKGMSTVGTVTDRGVSKAVDVKALTGADALARQSMDQLKEIFSGVFLVLPEEAVGPGAKWEVRTPARSLGMRIDQTKRYELITAEDDRLTAKVSVTERAPSQKIQIPGMAGMKMDLNKLVGTGTAEVTCDLSQLMPPKASADYHKEMTITMAGPPKQTIQQTISMEFRLEAK